MPAKLSDLEIQRTLSTLSGWTRRGETLVKVFSFSRFPDGIAFVRKIATLAEEMNHHPDIDIRYTKVTLILSTHSAGGITQLDLNLATAVEAAAGP